ncbi:MAG: T9SS type A sorting domain-containing protein [Bacteroidia bacterium]|nr:T9SS type A sorting domain-containing protein [Bacteroidia bacterium]MCF8446965.1 T9SS type A sorting domain-containing protein [Bacteroidia bacterium]
MFHGFANAQNYYSKMYDLFGGWESGYNIVEINEIKKTILFNGDFINQFDTMYDSLSWVHVHNFKTDFEGKLISKNILGRRYFNYYTGWPAISFINKKYNFLREDDTLNNIRYFIYELDSLGCFKNRTPIIGTSNQLRIRVIKQVSSKIYAFGFSGNVLGSPLAALCFDTSGKQLWYKVYNDKLVFPTGVAIASDGSFLVGGVQTKKGDISKGERDSLNPFFAKMDTLGNFIWEKKIPNIPNLSVSNISPIEINGVYYWFGGYPSSQKDLSKLAYSYLIKTNTSGDIILNKKIIEGKSAKGDYMVCHLGYPLFKNNFIYMLGQGSDTISNVKYNDYIQLCKLDTFGNIKWRRTFSQWYMSNRPYSLSAISDGFIICADGKDTTHSTGFTDAWIIKTDTNGCIVPGCHLLDGIIEVLDPKNFVKIYPNPAHTQVNILFDDPKQTKIDYLELFDEKGTLALTQKVNLNNFTLNTANLTNGLYYLAAYFNENKRVVKKLVIQHQP